MPDVEQVLVSFLSAQFPSARVVTETPASPEFESVLPIIQVVRVGGPRRFAIDRPTVVVDCFAAGPSSGATGRPAAKALAAQVADALCLSLPGARVAGAVVGHVVEVSGPSWTPWDNTNVRRVTATYQISLKAG
jgi:hypothetical protein